MKLVTECARLSIAYLLCLPCLLLSQPRGSSSGPTQIYKQASPAVVLIDTLDAQAKPLMEGTGFFVSRDGRLLTNFHVIAHSKSATITLANGDAYDEVEVLGVDKRKDIALLKIKAVNVPFVTLGRSNTVEIGVPVFAISNTLGYRNTMSEGIVSGIRQFEGYRLFQSTAPISHGSSGGPLFSAKGEVIGITNGAVEEGQSLNFAVPIDYAKGMLSATRPMPLESVYEPPNLSTHQRPEAITTSSSQVDRQPSDESVQVNAPLKKASRQFDMAFIMSQLGQWTSATAVEALGKPMRESSSTVGQRRMKELEYIDSTNPSRVLQLKFELETDVLVEVAVHLSNP